MDLCIEPRGNSRDNFRVESDDFDQFHLHQFASIQLRWFTLLLPLVNHWLVDLTQELTQRSQTISAEITNAYDEGRYEQAGESSKASGCGLNQIGNQESKRV